MIHVDRGEEPEDLAKERSRQLAHASIHGRPPEILGYGTKGVHSLLQHRQNHRCAYCGKFVEGVGDPIDHFRPKAYAEDANWSAIPAEPGEGEVGDFFKWFDEYLSTDRKERTTSPWVKNTNVYWWLAWTWENLNYACGACNSPTYKGNRFPLKRGTAVLAQYVQPPGPEKPLLVDPSRCDPLEHIRFARDTSNGWGPVPLTGEGRWTIAILGLNHRPSLRTEWINCAADIENNEAFKSFFVAVGKVTNDALRGMWEKLTQEWLYPRPDYRAFRWCVFDHHFREHRLKGLGLELPRPWKVVPSTPKPVFIERPELAPFPEQLQMRIRALRPRLDEKNAIEELKNVLVELCNHRALTSKELSAITDRKALTHLETEYLQPLTMGPSPRLAYDTQGKTYSRA